MSACLLQAASVAVALSAPWYRQKRTQPPLDAAFFRSCKQRLPKHGLQGQNVNAVALTKDVWLILEVPTTGLVTIVATSIQKESGCNLCSHFTSLVVPQYKFKPC